MAHSFYHALDQARREIRLLTLHPPTDPQSPIKCTIRHVSLEDEPDEVRYAALSYAWGDPNITTPIIINEISFPVTINLAAAMQRLIPEAEGQEYWIDAICINQTDIAERSDQITYMREIYGRALVVCIWLGEEEDDSLLAMQKINAWGPQDAYVQPIQTLLCQFEDPFDERSWNAISKFLTRPYWQRTWILQEITLASRAVIMCGPYLIQWTALREAVFAWTRVFEEFSEPSPCISWGDLEKMTAAGMGMKTVTVIIYVNKKQKSGQFTTSLLDLLELTDGHQVTDPRDKIYGILGLVSDRDKISPDYSKSVAEVYTDAMSKVVKHSPRALLRAGITFPTVANRLDIPTWVIDLRVLPGNTACQGPTFGIIAPYGLSESQAPPNSMRFSDDLRVLSLPLFIFDKIQYISLTGAPAPNFWEALILDGQSTTYPTGEPRLRALFRALLADADPKQLATGRLDPKTDKFFTLAAAFFQYIASVEYENFENAMRVGIPHPLISDFEARSVSPLVFHYLLWSKQTSNGRSEEEILEPFLGPRGGQGSLKWSQMTLGWDDWDRHEESTYRALRGWIDSMVERRTLFSTKKTYMGMGPTLTKEGDVIAVVPGVDMPLVLREADGQYLLVGPAYVHGIMDGEALKDENGEDVPLKRVEIR